MGEPYSGVFPSAPCAGRDAEGKGEREVGGAAGDVVASPRSDSGVDDSSPRLQLGVELPSPGDAPVGWLAPAPSG